MSNRITRMHYFSQQFLRTQDFTDEQAYHVCACIAIGVCGVGRIREIDGVSGRAITKIPYPLADISLSASRRICA